MNKEKERRSLSAASTSWPGGGFQFPSNSHTTHSLIFASIFDLRDDGGTIQRSPRLLPVRGRRGLNTWVCPKQETGRRQGEAITVEGHTFMEVSDRWTDVGWQFSWPPAVVVSVIFSRSRCGRCGVMEDTTTTTTTTSLLFSFSIIISFLVGQQQRIHQSAKEVVGGGDLKKAIS